MLTAARLGKSSHPILSRLAEASLINQAHGGAVIAAWEVGQLPDEWIEALTAVAVDLPVFQEKQNEVRKHFKTWRDKHPTYRKH